MPEGPEVKIISNYLNRTLNKLSILSVKAVSDPYKEKYKDTIEEINKYLPTQYHNSFCIGKQTFIQLKNGIFFSYHLGMTGFWSKKKEKHAHLCLKMNNNLNIYFHDTRRFGNIKILKSNNIKEKYHFNRDLLNHEKLNEHLLFLTSSIKSNLEICKLLLNQTYFPGVGNYLKSEILYACKIHPHTKWETLTNKKIKELCVTTKKIMTYCYEKGGAQLRDFKNPQNSSELKLKIYGRSKTKNGNIVTSLITKDNRRTFICLKTQKNN